MKIRRITLAVLAISASLCAYGQERLSLQECRDLAVRNNRDLDQARINADLAHYDRAIARANYFPNVSAAGTYMYNSMDVALIGDGQSAALRNAGTLIQGGLSEKMAMFQQLIKSNPAVAMEYMQSPMWQTVIGALSQTDISSAVNSIGCTVDDLLHPDLHNIVLAGVSLEQPLFVGGKIVAANRIAALAEDLARDRYDAQLQQTIVDVDAAYWQIVSVAAKLELANSYSGLLESMAHNADILVEEGVFTASDRLAIQVKANEASMMLAQASNGLKLAKMFLCRMTGLPLDTEIVLADESAGSIPVPAEHQAKAMDDILKSRPELLCLEDAIGIYDQKVKVARADMMPQVALTANYLATNVNVLNQNKDGLNGFWTAGVVMKVPIFHGLEALKKTQKAKAEASLYRSRYEDSVDLVNLEVSQLYARRQEALERLKMAESNLDCAEENMRTATIGFEEGVVESSVTLAAQAAWLQAHSECIDAGIELQMIESNLNRAEGSLK